MMILSSTVWPVPSLYPTWDRPSKTHFAIYDPGESSDGVWKPEVAALKAMLSKFGWTYEIVDHTAINRGHLGEGSESRFHGLIMPGGYAVPRLSMITPIGKRRIEAFIKAGGNYIGFCAGSYYATENLAWAEESTAVQNSYNLASDYIRYNNTTALNLLPGTAAGPFGWAAWKKGSVATGLETTRINLDVPVMQKIGMPAHTKLYYYGGPYFEFSKMPENLEIWATALKPNGVSHEASTGADKPTIVRFKSGKGNVILFSYHPVILQGGKLDGVRVQEPLNLASINTNPSPQTLDQVNYLSWNILHAALKIASNQTVVPMPRKTRLASVPLSFDH